MQYSIGSKIMKLLLGIVLIAGVDSHTQEKVSTFVCQLCPTIVVKGSSLGKAMIEFKAVVDGMPKEQKITYSWTVDDGELMGGQGTASIAVKPRRGVKATVRVHGLDLACSSTASSEFTWEPPPVAKLMDRYNRLPFEIDEAESARFVSVQGGTAAQDDDEWPPMSYLKSDYKSVAVVAHVVIREAEITNRIVGYENWRVVCEVIEPFKGKFKKGETIEYLHGAEAGFKKQYFTGEKIVFLLREYDKPTKRYRYTVLENSTLPAAEPTLKKLRIIRGRGRR
jgi:hypothetical protein